MTRNWAITIGINDYRYLQRLHYAKRDAEAVNQLFTEELKFEQVYHFAEDAEPIPQDYGPDLDASPTCTTLRRFFRKRFEQPFLREGDNLWCFFAGHGIRDQNRDYLMPIDGDRGDLTGSAIPIHYISERLRRSGADNIILLIDACRTYEGRRDGLGIGQEKQQGVITLFSCSPEESSYEIDEIQHGVFTHILLESLRLQGEGNCATVERLYQRLRYYVPQLTQQYRRDIQTPYGVIEPPSKNHLILLPQQATLGDIVAIKNDALTAEVRSDFALAKHLWVRVLAVSPADVNAIEGIERLQNRKSQQNKQPHFHIQDDLTEIVSQKSFQQPRGKSRSVTQTGLSGSTIQMPVDRAKPLDINSENKYINSLKSLFIRPEILASMLVAIPSVLIAGTTFLFFNNGRVSENAQQERKICPDTPTGSISDDTLMQEIDLRVNSPLTLTFENQPDFSRGYLFEAKAGQEIRYRTDADVCIWIFSPESSLLSNNSLKDDGKYLVYVRSLSEQEVQSGSIEIELIGNGYSSSTQTASQPSLASASAEEQSLSQDEAEAIVESWLKAKSKIFAPPFDRHLVASLTTGQLYRNLNGPGGSIDWLINNNHYYTYEQYNIVKVISFSESSDSPSLTLKLEEKTSLHGPNGNVNRQTNDVNDFIYHFKKDENIWKIRDYESK